MIEEFLYANDQNLKSTDSLSRKGNKMKKGKGTDTADLANLSQTQVAWMIEKPAVWLRDNQHLVERNADGTYDARKVVRGLRTEFEASELADSDLEPVLQFAEEIAYDLDGRSQIIQNWRAIEQRYGAAWLAAIAAVLLAEMEAAYELMGEPEPETATSIKAEFAEKLAAIENTNLRSQRRIVVLCDRCRKYRWGRRWIKADPPTKMSITRTTCPSCET